jgi:dihydropteroate synthase
MTRKRFQWKIRDRLLALGDRTLIMGVLNVTPDSFSDGGNYSDPDRAFARAVQLEEEGADIIDIGAESTRPGSTRISEAEELRRLIPVLKRLKGKLSIPISVDTYKAAVAEKAVEHGAVIINDPSALTWDPALARVIAQNDAGLILNHMRGTPESWAKLGPLKDLMGTIRNELEASVHRARRGGVSKERIVIDPGIGFGKRKEQNAEIIALLGQLEPLHFPIMVGPSRKSFLAQKALPETDFATAAAVTAAIMTGASIVRVHNVAAMKPVCQVADEIVSALPESRVDEPRAAKKPAPESRPAAAPPPPREHPPRRDYRPPRRDDRENRPREFRPGQDAERPPRFGDRRGPPREFRGPGRGRPRPGPGGRPPKRRP